MCHNLVFLFRRPLRAQLCPATSSHPGSCSDHAFSLGNNNLGPAGAASLGSAIATAGMLTSLEYVATAGIVQTVLSFGEEALLKA